MRKLIITFIFIILSVSVFAQSLLNTDDYVSKIDTYNYEITKDDSRELIYSIDKKIIGIPIKVGKQQGIRWVHADKLKTSLEAEK